VPIKLKFNLHNKVDAKKHSPKLLNPFSKSKYGPPSRRPLAVHKIVIYSR